MSSMFNPHDFSFKNLYSEMLYDITTIEQIIQTRSYQRKWDTKGQNMAFAQ